MSEINRLRKGIQDYLDGNYDNPRKSRPEPCKHGRLWYESCEACTDEHFAKLLSDETSFSIGEP